MSNVTYEQAFSKAFAHIGAAMDIFQSIPRPNGATTKALSNGHAQAKALPAPQKVKKGALKALPPAPEAAVAEAAPVKPAKVKAAKAAKVKAAPKVKAAKPVKAKAAAKAPKAAKAIVKAKADKPAKAKAPKGAPANAIAAGRRAVASGERPKLRDAIAIVMAKETLTAGDILARLKERGWEPGASNPQSYISYTLSDNAETFKRGKRGEYSVVNPKAFEKIAAQFKGSKTSGKAERVASTDAGEAEAPATDAEPELQAAVEAAPEAAPVAGDPPNTTPSATTETDEALASLGLGQTAVGENPFDSLN